MDTPSADIKLCLDSHARLRTAVAQLSDDDCRRPSLLPGWSVGHLLTHLARNADSVVRRLEGARRDEIVDQYPGGATERSAEIEAGAGRPAAEIRQDVEVTCEAVDAALVFFPTDHWDRLCRTFAGDEVPVGSLPFARAL